MRSRCSQLMTARINCSSLRKATQSASIQRRLSLVAGLDSRRSAAVWRFFSFEDLRDFNLAFGECAIVYGIGLVSSRSCGLAATGSVAELRRCVDRRGQRFRREHCGDKPASVGVLSWVHFLSVSLQRVLVFRFVDEANARASNKPSHSDLDLRTLCCRCFGAALEREWGSLGIGFGSATGHEWTICFYDEIWIRPYFRSLSLPVFSAKFSIQSAFIDRYLCVMDSAKSCF